MKSAKRRRSEALYSPERWQLVLERAPLADGQFVYAVRSTGIYCKPSCPSRRPRTEHVEFFDKACQAEEAGYRSCLRCRPDSIAPQTQVATTVCKYLESNVDRKVTLDELAKQVNLSAFHLQRVFKQQTGVSPRQYQASLRSGAIRTHLSKASSVTDVDYGAEYASRGRFYESARRDLGISLSAWRRGGLGISIRYSAFTSPLGEVLLAATSKNVCFLALGDNDEALLSALRAELPASQIRRDDDGLSIYREVVFEYLAGGTPHPDLPWDVRATAFQSRVRQILRKTPKGATRMYSDIALELGNTTLTRAAGRACATNSVPLVIPCHRVTRRSGNLAGYRWGLARKRKLLDMEQAMK